MTIDRHGNIWVTDVAMHQVFKFRPGSLRPSVTIGQRFLPGSSPNFLCKPTAVAVASTGEVFILLFNLCYPENLFIFFFTDNTISLVLLASITKAIKNAIRF